MLNCVTHNLTLQRLACKVSKKRMVSLCLIYLRTPHVRFYGRVVIDDNAQTVTNQGNPYIYPILENLTRVATTQDTECLKDIYSEFVFRQGVKIGFDVLNFSTTIRGYKIIPAARNALTP